MISNRCKKQNLLNHLKQKNIKYEVIYNEILLRNADYKRWKVIFIFNNKKYSVINNRKKDGFELILNSCNDDIHSYLSKL